jgi:GNAT superfamily N-acetyltransferase
VLCDGVVRKGLFRRLEHVGIAMSSLRLRSSQRRAHAGLQPGMTGGGAARGGIACALVQAVTPDRRGRGIPERYMTALFEAFRREGITEVRGTVSRDNIRVRRSLEKNGWVLLNENGDSCCYSRSIVLQSRESRSSASRTLGR